MTPAKEVPAGTILEQDEEDGEEEAAVGPAITATASMASTVRP